MEYSLVTTVAHFGVTNLTNGLGGNSHLGLSHCSPQAIRPRIINCNFKP
ncbi:MAG: hypothetical protein BMS9Abin18_1100 [Zetaproteobacteria bacterium]|nr:MAG: hypothetical protein BMS9Abin18_1100 [Zetaproteobacteria bacterium]